MGLRCSAWRGNFIPFSTLHQLRVVLVVLLVCGTRAKCTNNWKLSTDFEIKVKVNEILCPGYSSSFSSTTKHLLLASSPRRTRAVGYSSVDQRSKISKYMNK